jgi:hypothetical protein
MDTVVDTTAVLFYLLTSLNTHASLDAKPVSASEIVTRVTDTTRGNEHQQAGKLLPHAV